MKCDYRALGWQLCTSVLRNDIYPIAKALLVNSQEKNKTTAPERVPALDRVDLSLSLEFMWYTDSPEWLLHKLIFLDFFVIYLAISNELMISMRITCARDEVFFPMFVAAITKANFNVSSLSIVDFVCAIAAAAAVVCFLFIFWVNGEYSRTCLPLRPMCVAAAAAATTTTDINGRYQ